MRIVNLNIFDSAKVLSLFLAQVCFLVIPSQLSQLAKTFENMKKKVLLYFKREPSQISEMADNNETHNMPNRLE